MRRKDTVEKRVLTLKHNIVLEIKFLLLTSSLVQQCRRVLLGILGREEGEGRGWGGASCFSKSLTLFKTKTVMVFTPVFIHGGLEIMTSLLGLEHEQNRNLNRYFSLSL